MSSSRSIKKMITEDEQSIRSSYSASSAGFGIAYGGGGRRDSEDSASIYSSSSQADAFASGFAMRQAMSLDGGGLLSAMMDGGDAGSIASFGSSSYTNRKKVSPSAARKQAQDEVHADTAPHATDSVHQMLENPQRHIDGKKEQRHDRSMNKRDERRRTRRSSDGDSRGSRVLGRSDIRKLPPKLQSAALVLLDLDDKTSRKPGADMKLARTPRSTSRRATMWEKQRIHTETTCQSHQLNLNATSFDHEMEQDENLWRCKDSSVKSMKSQDDFCIEDQFFDEIPLEYRNNGDCRLSEKRESLADQLSKRKRIKIYKRKKSRRPQQRGRWFYATVFAILAVALVAIAIFSALFLTNATNKQNQEQHISATSNSTSSAPSAHPSPPLIINETFPIHSDQSSLPAVHITTSPPSQPPTISPTTPLSLSNPPPHCFTSRDQLKEAIDAYMMDHSKYSPVAQKHGFPIGSWCVTFVTDFSSLFHNGALATDLVAHEDALSLKFLHFDESLNGWDVSRGRSFANCFRGAKYFTRHGLEKWNVSNAMTMSHMFHGAEHFNENIGSWDVSKVVDFEAMFEGTKAFDGKDVFMWDTSRATSMKRMFRNAHAFKGDVRAWSLSQVEHIEEMFSRAVSFQGGDLRRWDISRVKSLEGVFFHATSFQGIVSTWDTSKVVTFSQMFQGAVSFNSAIHDWDVGNAEDMSFMFAFAIAFDSPLPWNTNKLKLVDAMFMNATAFNQPLNDWNVSGIYAADAFLLNAKRFNQPLDRWKLTSIEKMGGMFSGASSFHQNLCAWGQALPGDEGRHTLLHSDHLEAQHTTLFSNTACPETGNPLFLLQPAGPFCDKCS